ncbi:MAG: GDSL-type esterase/lipase family protein [Chitinophagaceae bacterium]
MHWYEEEVQRIETEKSQLSYQPEMIFYGSSSIRLWDNLYSDFRVYSPVNLGFGGSTLEACVWYFDRLMQDFSPEHIVVYAGDNDLGDGKKPLEVFSYFKQLSAFIKKRFPDVSFSFISIKPSLARWNINNLISETNHLIKDAIVAEGQDAFYVDVYEKMVDQNGYPQEALFDADGLHLNQTGYAVWKKTLLTHFSLNNNIFII